MLIIFDFDGPLYKASWGGLFEADKGIIKAQGKDYREFFKSLNEFKRWRSPDWRKNIQKMGIKIKDWEKSHRIFYEIYNSHCYLFPWVGGILGELGHRHQLALLTNRHRENTKKILGALKGHFSFIIGGEDVKDLKPSPEGIKIILKEFYFNPEDVLMIGDTPEDIMAGKAAGIKTGAVKWGLGDWDELMAYLPDYAFEEPEHLLQI